MFSTSFYMTGYICVMVLVPKPPLIFCSSVYADYINSQNKKGGGLEKKKANGNKYFSSVYLSAFTLQLFEVY